MNQDTKVSPAMQWMIDHAVPKGTAPDDIVISHSVKDGEKFESWLEELIATSKHDAEKNHSSASKKSRGFCALGFVSQSKDLNTPHLFRAAHAYGADLLVFDTPSVRVSSAINTSKAERHIPTLIGDVKKMKPYGARVVAIEFIDTAQNLIHYDHPEQAYYIFGPETGSLSESVLDWADDIVYIPTRFCMNLAACANVVLYDRLVKRS